MIAPTGTIGLVMDCDTTGIEPDFALVKFKKLAGGGYFKIINRMVPDALVALRYDAREVSEIVSFAVGHGTLAGAPFIDHEALMKLGFGEEQIAAIEEAIPNAFDIKFVFNKWTLGQDFLHRNLGNIRRTARRSYVRSASPSWLRQRPDRNRECSCLRRHDHWKARRISNPSTCRFSIALIHAGGPAPAISLLKAIFA